MEFTLEWGSIDHPLTQANHAF